ncbi:sterol 26-hydroxylase, mitochondrial isoform X2 [Thalassophryne amazonica]|uniref:sterol 26-hydroxylase, mitochondrial isoform X2 n=1 Tax=Thalassophryne amazonica TaxID=390379 RepID=UPI001471D5AD|nr:sterol 26-hydroxylase, mitochondrial isoform X2 [Thalassophryne amazonica]
MAVWLSRSVRQRNVIRFLACPAPVAQVCSRWVETTSSTPVTVSRSQDKPRTADDLPRVGFLMQMYRMVFQGYYSRMHELQIHEKQIYGSMYRGGLKSVWVNTPQLLEEVLRKDDKFPTRGDMTLWTEFRDMKGFGYGPFTEEGERWYNLRLMLNKRMLHPKDAAQYGGVINEVVTDFIKRIYHLRQSSPTGDLVTNVANELYRFSLETIKLIDKKMEVIEERAKKNEEVEGEYLTYLLANSQMNTKEVYSSIAELLLAGVDTTSNTLTWTMYLLSKYPQEQDTLHKEVSSWLLADTIPSAEEVTRMPYLKAVIKEALRMYPVVVMNARISKERDVVIDGYHFPKKTSFTFSHYAISHDEDTFPEPFMFKPDRWLRDGRERPNPFGSIPFGFGVRGCVGRRIAEIEMYMALFRVIRLFEIRADPAMGEVKSISRTVLIPNRNINLHFVDRGSKITT